METSVTIKNGITEIVLTPENTFELDVIEKIIYKKYHLKESKAVSDYDWQCHKNHRIELVIEKNKTK